MNAKMILAALALSLSLAACANKEEAPMEAAQDAAAEASDAAGAAADAAADAGEPATDAAAAAAEAGEAAMDAASAPAEGETPPAE